METMHVNYIPATQPRSRHRILFLNCFSYYRNKLITASTEEQKLVIGFLAQIPQREVTVKRMDVKLFCPKLFRESRICLPFSEKCLH